MNFITQYKELGLEAYNNLSNRREKMEMLRSESLIDKAIRLDKEVKVKKKELDEVKAELQTEGLKELENKKYVQFYGDKGSCEVMYKQKMEIENIDVLKEVFGNVIDNKIKTVQEIKYDIESKFKKALISLYVGDYKEHDLYALLTSLGLDDDKKKVALKKLKGEYAADKKVLESLGAVDEDGLEEELDIIREHKNFELVSKYIDINAIDDNLKKQIQRALSIEDTLSLGLTYEK